MSVNRKELEAMIAKALALGACVTVTRDKGDYPETIQVKGISGIGPFPMGAIGFSEAMCRVGLGVRSHNIGR